MVVCFIATCLDYPIFILGLMLAVIQVTVLFSNRMKVVEFAVSNLSVLTGITFATLAHKTIFLLCKLLYDTLLMAKISKKGNKFQVSFFGFSIRS